MWKLIKFAWWNIYYLPWKFRGYYPRKIDERFFLMVSRTSWPWRTFKPYVWHNEDGKRWHVHFEADSDRVVHLRLPVNAHVSQETGMIVGLTIRDETLKQEQVIKADD